MYIFQSLFNTHETQTSLIYNILGCIFLLIGGLGGVFFLFQALILLLGYLEGGAIACCILIVFGSILLFINKKRNTSPPEEIIQKALASFKDFHMEKLLKNNALPISLISLVLGVVLSQVKNLPEIYKNLK